MIPLEDIRRARRLIAGHAIRTPLIRLHAPEAPAEIYLKLENLQPIGAFKLRGAANAMLRADPQQLARGVLTGSAGNHGQGVAWVARALGVPCTVVVADTASPAKLAAIERLGGRIVKVPWAAFIRGIVEHAYPGLDGVFVHPFEDEGVMAGQGTIGLEVLEDLPDPDVVLIPWGGGGLACGVASALRALRPTTRIFAVEVETAAPLSASFAAGAPRTIERRPSFVDGTGAELVFAKMWPLAQELLDGALVASPQEAAAAVRVLAERGRVIAEGAGALAVAVALSGKADGGKIVCVVSGGNIDFGKLCRIFAGETP